MADDKSRLTEAADELERVLRTTANGQLSERDRRLVARQRRYCAAYDTLRPRDVDESGWPKEASIRLVLDVMVDTWELGEYTPLPQRIRRCLAHLCTCEMHGLGIRQRKALATIAITRLLTPARDEDIDKRRDE